MEKIKSEASGFIREAAKHADKGNYSLALNEINRALEKIYRVDPKTCDELRMIRKVINTRIVSLKNGGKKKSSEHLGDWLEKTARDLNGYNTMQHI